MNLRLAANGMLLLVTLFWGFSYLFMKMGRTAAPSRASASSNADHEATEAR